MLWHQAFDLKFTAAVDFRGFLLLFGVFGVLPSGHNFQVFSPENGAIAPV